MVPIADRGLCHLRDQRLGIAQQQAQKRAEASEFLFQRLRPQPIAVAGALHHRATGRGLAPHEQRNAQNPLVADDRDFSRRPVFHHVQQRDDRGGREIHIAQLHARFVQHIAKVELHQLQMCRNALVIVGRQRIKQVVLVRAVSRVCGAGRSVRCQ